MMGASPVDAPDWQCPGCLELSCKTARIGPDDDDVPRGGLPLGLSPGGLDPAPDAAWQRWPDCTGLRVSASRVWVSG